MDRIYKMVKEHAEDLISMAQQYANAESSNESVANTLSSDVIV